MVVQDMQVHKFFTAQLALQLELLSFQAFQGFHFIRVLLVDIIFVSAKLGAVFEIDNAKFAING